MLLVMHLHPSSETYFLEPIRLLNSTGLHMEILLVQGFWNQDGKKYTNHLRFIG